jgi:uncharacterized protein YbjT (DUF2867 family)
MRILVTAPNGNVGSHVATLLRARGISHRLAARTVGKARQDFPGSEVVHFDYGDEATAMAALVGVDAIFLASQGGEGGGAREPICRPCPFRGREACCEALRAGGKSPSRREAR